MTIATSGLKYYFNAKQGVSGSAWNDLGPNGYHLATTNLTTNADGVVFSGSGSRGQSSSGNLVPAQTSFTLEVALKIGSSIPHSLYIILGFVGGNATGASINSSRVARINDSTGSVVSTYTIPANTMTILTYKRISSTQVALYVNGVFHSNITVANVLGIVGQLIVGTDDGGGDFIGTIAFIREYDRALSDAEITTNFAQGLEVALTDAGTDVSYAYATKQASYANRSDPFATTQKSYANRTTPYAMTQKSYADRTTPFALQQRSYIDAQTAYATQQRMFNQTSVSFAMQQRSYALRSSVSATMQLMYIQYALSVPLQQRSYADRQTSFQLIIKSINPDDVRYKQTIQFRVMIKRKMELDAYIKRTVKGNVDIKRLLRYEVKI